MVDEVTVPVRHALRYQQARTDAPNIWEAAHGVVQRVPDGSVVLECTIGDKRRQRIQVKLVSDELESAVSLFLMLERQAGKGRIGGKDTRK